MTEKKKGSKDSLKVKNLPASAAKAANEVKGGMRPRADGGKGVTGTQAASTVCATGPKSEDCAC